MRTLQVIYFSTWAFIQVSFIIVKLYVFVNSTLIGCRLFSSLFGVVLCDVENLCYFFWYSTVG